MTTAIINDTVERKIIHISGKRQITIPQKFFEALSIGDTAECILNGGSIIIRPFNENAGGEFAEQILKDLIQQGYEGQTLLDRFKETSKKIRPAVEALMLEAEDIAKTGKGATMHDIFDSED
ncbi:MAG: AbrB/MazE/SpoVT family DNA-binding domain-containing protein [Clostridia bacterium]|jgi:bifunctional DNA-binding transcriptional regulator/antitoxin component of YhaV-PrlF toxin-antitoxin module